MSMFSNLKVSMFLVIILLSSAYANGTCPDSHGKVGKTLSPEKPKDSTSFKRVEDKVKFRASGTAWAGRFIDVELTIEMLDSEISVNGPKSNLGNIRAKRVPNTNPPIYEYFDSNQKQMLIEVSPGLKKGETGTVTFIDGKHRNRFNVGKEDTAKTVKFEGTGLGLGGYWKQKVDASFQMNEHVVEISMPGSYITAVRVEGSKPARYEYVVKGLEANYTRYVEVSQEASQGKVGTVTFIEGESQTVFTVK